MAHKKAGGVTEGRAFTTFMDAEGNPARVLDHDLEKHLRTEKGIAHKRGDGRFAKNSPFMKSRKRRSRKRK